MVEWLRKNATFTPSSKGEAADTIRGFVYQSERAVWVLLKLAPGQLLQVEMQEDYDIQEVAQVSRAATADQNLLALNVLHDVQQW